MRIENGDCFSMSKKKKVKNNEDIVYEYKTIFINGKQKRIRCEPTIDGMSVDEFIRNNADLIWLHQNEMWELIEVEEDDNEYGDKKPIEPKDYGVDDSECDDDLPF